MTLPVSPTEFSSRLERGVKAENVAMCALTLLGHKPEAISLAGTMELDFEDRERHRKPDIKCVRCDLQFEIRSSVVGLTMGHSEARPFWEDKPRTCIILHVNLENQRITAIRLADLMARCGDAERRVDGERHHPYLQWPAVVVNQIAIQLLPCTKDNSYQWRYCEGG
ncbi:MAG: hypothetical protein PVI20_09795 [Desulfobacteraceae bacterium]|jgi:hypothetical protein